MRPPPVIRTGYAKPDAGSCRTSKTAANRNRGIHREGSWREIRKPPDVEAVYRRLTIGASQIATKFANCDGAQAADARSVRRARPVQKSRKPASHERTLGSCSGRLRNAPRAGARPADRAVRAYGPAALVMRLLPVELHAERVAVAERLVLEDVARPPRARRRRAARSPRDGNDRRGRASSSARARGVGFSG